MHRLNNALGVEFYNSAPQPANAYSIPTLKVAAFEANLEQDCLDYYYNAVCTFAEAINGLKNGSFAWATVQLYYSSFYSARSILGANSIAILYEKSKPFSLKILPNSSPRKENGNTHEVAFKIINRELTIPEFSQPIDGKPPFDWLKEKREEANYKLAKIYDPNMPSHFNYTSEDSLYKSINAYITDIKQNQLNFPYDKDHAIIAFPLLCLSKNRGRLKTKGSFLSDPDISYLSSLISPQAEELKNLLLSP